MTIVWVVALAVIGLVSLLAWSRYRRWKDRDLGIVSHHWLAEQRQRSDAYPSGETDRVLVVETTNFNGRSPMMIVGPGGNAIPTSESLRIVERFSRVTSDRLDYELSVEDPIDLTEPWKAEVPWPRDPSCYIFEYPGAGRRCSCRIGSISFTTSLSADWAVVL